ncbi:hypothetical protein [Phyllobacterium sp. P30BS-XVII]|uniref:hypothetical protein n=1 Tax=Phyllobacterium sp. P30BS-XVII TaxID=2587046 RepID=UPI0015FBC3B5|nr:hypothetical protein [Phyllobacterium sp. P30BS-XVII]MBA8899506.1 hypothetical protein [Phyllobacterium sp. P30BS-XVII]
MADVFRLTRALARVFAFGTLLICTLACVAACTTARQPTPATPVLQDEKPEPLAPGIKPLTVDEAEQVGW